MPAKKKAAGTASPTSRSRVTSALRKATGVVAKATGRQPASATTTAKKSAAPAKKAAPTKASAAAQKSGAKKASAPVAKKAAKKASATKKVSAAKKAAPTKKTATAAKKAAAKTTSAKKTAPSTKATPTKKTAPAKAAKKTAKSPAKKAAGKVAATSTPAKKTAAKKSAPTKKSPAASAAPTKKAAQVKQETAAQQSATPHKTRQLKVRDDESPWTAKELAAVRAELEGDVARLSAELSGFEDDIAGLIKDSGDGAGDDQADAGAKTFEREHEYSLAQNSRDLLEQSVHALQRIDDGTYGVCENCGNAIGKMRLQAFPRATLCLTCKAQQERR